MKKSFPPLLLILALMLLLSGAMAAERFPPPDFGPGYSYPSSSQVVGRAGWLAWVDLGVLGVALTLAAWVIYRRRSRKLMLGLTVASLLYFGFYRQGCICPVGAVQNVAQALFDPAFILSYAVIGFFTLPLLFALFFGRVFCGGVCPLGAIQDLVLLKPLKLPRWLEQGLGTLRYVYLGLAVLFAATGTSYVICKYDPFVAFFRHEARLGIWIWSGSMLALAMFIGRPYCRILCPYGALLGIFSRFSFCRVTITPDRCITCHLCRESCPFDAIRDGRREEGEPDA